MSGITATTTYYQPAATAAQARAELAAHLQAHHARHGDAGHALTLRIGGALASVPEKRWVRTAFHHAASQSEAWRMRAAIRQTPFSFHEPVYATLADHLLVTVDYLARHRAAVAGYLRFQDTVVILVPPVCASPDGGQRDGQAVAASLAVALIKAMLDNGAVLPPESTVAPISGGVALAGVTLTLQPDGTVEERSETNHDYH